MSKLIVSAAAVVGYVLGAKSGRARYEYIKAQAQRVRQDPRVQKQAAKTADLITHGVSEAAGHVSDAAKQAAGTVTSDGTHPRSGDTRHTRSNTDET